MLLNNSRVTCMFEPVNQYIICFIHSEIVMALRNNWQAVCEISATNLLPRERE